MKKIVIQSLLFTVVASIVYFVPIFLLNGNAFPIEDVISLIIFAIVNFVIDIFAFKKMHNIKSNTREIKKIK